MRRSTIGGLTGTVSCVALRDLVARSMGTKDILDGGVFSFSNEIQLFTALKEWRTRLSIRSAFAGRLCEYILLRRIARGVIG